VIFGRSKKLLTRHAEHDDPKLDGKVDGVLEPAQFAPQRQSGSGIFAEPFLTFHATARLLRMRIPVLRLLFASSLLLLPAALHAQFGGEGKPTNDTATIHTTCTPDGTQTIKDDYSGSVYIDHTATKKYMLPIDGARARGEWNEVLRLANMSIKNAPKCYYAYFAKAQSELYQCKLPDAKESFGNFIQSANGSSDYQSLVVVSKDLLDSINSGDAAAKCK
jgi:hypothetical protein